MTSQERRKRPKDARTPADVPEGYKQVILPVGAVSVTPSQFMVIINGVIDLAWERFSRLEWEQK